MATGYIPRRLLLSLLIAFGTGAAAQLVAPQLRVIDGKDGLSSGRVSDMAKDQRGYLWIATASGLNRFDGRQVKTYHNDGGDQSLPADFTTSLAVDTGHLLYVGTSAAFLTILDVLEDTLVNIPLPDPAYSRHGEQRITDILIDQQQRIWVAHGARCLSLFDPRTASFTTTEIPPPLPTPRSRELIHFIHEDRDGTLWLSLFKGLVRFDPGTMTPMAMNLHPAPGEPDLARMFQVRGLVDEDSALVFGTWSEGVFRMRKSDGQLHLLWPEPDHVPTYLDHVITDMARVSETKVLMASIDMGLLQLDLPTGRVDQFNRRFTEADCRKTENTFLGCYRVKKFDDLLVLGSKHRGVAIGSLREGPVQAVALPLHDPEEFKDEVVAAVHVPGSTDVLALSIRRGLFLHDAMGRLKWYSVCSYNPRNGMVSLQHLTGDRWLVGAWRKAQIAALHRDSSLHVVHGVLAACGVAIEWARPAGGHGLWCYVRDKGVILLDTVTGTCTTLAEKWPKVAAAMSTIPKDVFLDMQGRTWFLSANQPPIVRYPDGRVQRINGPASLAPFDVYDLAQTPDGRIWLAVKHTGLARVEATGAIDPVDVSQRLPTRAVVQVAAMADGTLWLVGPAGLLHWDPMGQKGRLLYNKDGIQSEPLNLDPSQEPLHYPVLVGTWEGYYMVSDPTTDVPAAVRVQLPAVLCMDTLVLRNADRAGTPVTLPHTADRITIRLRSNDLLNPARNELAYRLIGQSDHWISVGNDQRITFNHLPHGHYRFEARARQKSGPWGPVAAMQLTILPPVWATWWFRTLAVLLLIVAGWALVRAWVGFKLRKQRRLMEREQALLQERIRIAHDLHDDLGSGLASIRMESAMAGMGVAEKNAHDALMHVSETARNVGDDLRRIIWAMGSGQESLGDLLAYIRSHAAEVLDQAGMDLHFDAQVTHPARKMTVDQRRHLVLFTKEALHNVVKHAEARHFAMVVTEGPGQLQWRITDDGKGFDVEACNTNGTGTTSMAKRAKALHATLKVDSAPGKGTCLELTMPW